jgi:hypothetical protein
MHKDDICGRHPLVCILEEGVPVRWRTDSFTRCDTALLGSLWRGEKTVLAGPHPFGRGHHMFKVFPIVRNEVQYLQSINPKKLLCYYLSTVMQQSSFLAFGAAACPEGVV